MTKKAPQGAKGFNEGPYKQTFDLSHVAGLALIEHRKNGGFDNGEGGRQAALTAHSGGVASKFVHKGEIRDAFESPDVSKASGGGALLGKRRIGAFVPPPDDEEDSEGTAILEARQDEAAGENLSLCFSMLFFLLFLVVFTLSVYFDKQTPSYMLKDHLTAALNPGGMALTTVKDVDSLYGYLETTFASALFINNTDTNEAFKLSTHLRPVDGSNWILGAIRFRQERVVSVPNCQLAPLFANFNISCYPTFIPSLEAKDKFGPGGNFSFSTDPTGTPWNGWLGSYTANGYIVTIPPTEADLLSTVDSLRMQVFLDSASRALFIDFVLWSSNVGSFAVCTILFELGPSGEVANLLQILPVDAKDLKPGGMGTSGEWVAFFFSLAVMVFVLRFLAEEIQEIRTDLRMYFTDGWNILDWVNVVLLVVGFILRIMVWAGAGNPGVAQLSNPGTWLNMRPLAEQALLVTQLACVNIVLFWVKAVKYLRHLPIIKGLVNSIWDSFGSFVPFIIMFLISFTGFVMAFNFGFGDYIWEVSTFGRSFVFMLNAFVRQVTLDPVYRATPTFGAFLILAFWIVLVLVGVNVMFGVFADALNRAKRDKERKEQEEMLAFLHKDEPLEESVRVVSRAFSWIFKKLFPRTYIRLFEAHKLETESDGESSPGGALASFDGGSKVSPALKDKDRSEKGAMSDSMSSAGESVDVTKSAPRITQQEVLKAIERMSGRILSEIAIVSLEIQSELHDVCERIAQMLMAAEELSWRAEQVTSLDKQLALDDE